MRDLVFMALTVGFFGLASLFVIACDRIVGPDPTGDDIIEGGYRGTAEPHPQDAAAR